MKATFKLPLWIQHSEPEASYVYQEWFQKSLRKTDISALDLSLKGTVGKTSVSLRGPPLKRLDAQDLKIFQIILEIELTKWIILFVV